MEKSEAIINFMYFGHNYPSTDFITEAFEGSLGNHFKEKFSDMYQRHGTLTFFRWYMELSDNNKTILNDWIEENYNYKTS